MADDDNVISLEARRVRRRSERAEPGPAGDSGGAPESKEAEAAGPLPGKLIWLHCPACDTLEYSEIEIPGGRRHKCGAVVREAAVEIDVRAEATVAEINLRRIDALSEYLDQQRQRYLEYRRRLESIAGQPAEPYPIDDGVLKRLPVAEMDALGLLVSQALHDPAKRFEDKDEP